MIVQIKDTPKNIAAFRASGTVLKEDFQKVLLPVVEELIDRTGEINFLLYLDTDLGNFSSGAWFEDIMLGLKNLGKWHRAAIVTDSAAIITFTNTFTYLVPGEFRGFKKEQYKEAVAWVSSL